MKGSCLFTTWGNELEQNGHIVGCHLCIITSVRICKGQTFVNLILCNDLIFAKVTQGGQVVSCAAYDPLPDSKKMIHANWLRLPSLDNKSNFLILILMRYVVVA